MYTGYYTKKMREEQDPYLGLFNKKQLQDLEGETELNIQKVSHTKLQKQIRQQKGAGLTLTDPMFKIKKL